MRLSLLAVAASFLSRAALAQGVPDARTGVLFPTSQAASVEDATALDVNPAGLAFMDGLELNLGGFVRSDGRVTQSDVDGIFALHAFDGVGLGLESSLVNADGQLPQLDGAASIAFGLDRAASLGLALHGVGTVGGGGRADVQLDVGTQLRPARFLAVGAVLEGIGANRRPASARLGLSLRPFDELLTIGVDARVIPGSKDFSSPDFGNFTIVPGAVARLDLGGFGVVVGASMQNLASVAAGPADLELSASLVLDGEHLGLWGTGAVGGILSGAVDGAGGVRIRASSAEYEPIFPSRGRWLAMSLTGDGVPVDEGSGLLHDLFGEKPQEVATLTALDNVADDPSVEGFVVELRGIGLGWGRLAELRHALARLKERGKKVVVQMDGGDDADVYLASVADKVYLTPAGSLDLNGLRAELVYFGDTLEKVGVEAEAVKAGRYKSAPRQFTADEPSPEELEVQNALLDGVYAALVDMIAKGRGLTPERVKAIIDEGGLTAQQALDDKIIDGVAYEDELDKKLADLAGHPVSLDEHFLDAEKNQVRWDSPPHIALIPITGTIAGGHGGGGLFGATSGAQDIVDAVHEAMNDGDVKAIVLRIDSPGGDALASDLIWHAVMEAREKKPVVCSMGDVAASGGYYVASAAQTIFAEDNTITGSIGVFGLLFNAERLADKVGVRETALKRGARPGPTLFHPLSDAERTAMQKNVDATYQRFLDSVITGRGAKSGLTKPELAKIAEGHVWTGAQAKERKLVDQIGGLRAALADAKKRADIPQGEDVSLDVMTGRAEDLLKLTGLAGAFARTPDAAAVATAARLLLGDPEALALALDSEGRPLAVAPFTVRVR